SHGSDEPLLSVSNGILPLEQVSGDNLASALRDSGIKWRVIVISACHAGAFIAPLKDPDTLLITAAAADKTSFGCSDDRDLTYFGEAFYRDALPRAKSLQDAFALTRAAIATREQAEHVTASDPQAYVGAQIEQLLSQRPMRAPVP
ncbi:MAG TPA: C13 family peptidase, partial [Steroidobacteraceae bacterium]